MILEQEDIGKQRMLALDRDSRIGIIGAGMVGKSLAVALSRAPTR